MQLSLEKYTESQAWREHLKRLGYIESKKAEILFLLWDLNFHNTKQVNEAGGSQYNARIKELRNEGWDIDSEKLANGEWGFRLIKREAIK